MSDDRTDEGDKSNTNRNMDDTIRELAGRLDDIIEEDNESLWIDPKGEQLWYPYSATDTDAHPFVGGATGMGMTTRLINWWKQLTARDEESPTWIDPKGDSIPIQTEQTETEALTSAPMATRVGSESASQSSDEQSEGDDD